MLIKNINLTDFRNFSGKNINFSENITVIVGPNGSGKTNILESLFLLSTGKSFKAKVEEESINYDADISRIKGKFDGPDLEAVITRGIISFGERTDKIARKKLLVNGVAKRLIDFAGNFKVVLFGPWDMDLVTESPSIRRKFLDNVLSQVDREYRRNLLSYEKGLRQRNRLLFRIREEGVSRSQLIFWNQLLIKTGEYISLKRKEFIDFVNNHPSPNDREFKLHYDNSVISPERLEQYKDAEVGAATTLVGPHRDDFVFKIRGKEENGQIRDLSAYGSRGEQRMGILWIKMAELNFIEEKTGERPTLLLDDIFSELDHEHRDVVMIIAKKQQTVITTADEHFLENDMVFEKIRLT